VSLPSPSEQAQWVRDIKGCIKEFQKKKLRDLAEAKRKATQGSSPSASPVIEPMDSKEKDKDKDKDTDKDTDTDKDKHKDKDKDGDSERILRRKSSRRLREGGESTSASSVLMGNDASADGAQEKKKRKSKRSHSTLEIKPRKSKSIDGHKARRHSKSKLKGVSLDGELVRGSSGSSDNLHAMSCDDDDAYVTLL
jgi:pre-mRNA-splicing regulator WTAP